MYVCLSCTVHYGCGIFKHVCLCVQVFECGGVCELAAGPAVVGGVAHQSPSLASCGMSKGKGSIIKSFNVKSTDQ